METCLNFSLRKANRVLNKIYDGYMLKCGLKTGQFSILRVVNFRKQTTNKELQNIMLVDQTTLSRSLKPLIRDGYIQVTQGQDARVKLLSLTPEGKQLFIQASVLWKQAQMSVKKQLGSESTKQLLEVSSIISNLKV